MKTRLRNRTTLYPWREWLAKKAVTLRRGVDFQCEPYIMAQQIRNYVRTWEIGDVAITIKRDVVEVEFDAEKN